MDKDRSTIGVGLIGHGRAGTVIHAPLIEGVEGLRIVAVATSNPDGLAARRDSPRAYADPGAMMGDPDVDLVVIATPNDTHVAYAQQALRCGKHVVIDKPFALTTGEAKGLIALAAQVGRKITAFHNRRWDGDFLAARQALAGEMVGRLTLFEACWDRFRPEAPQAWRNSDRAGAGVLWDLGSHMIDQAISLFGMPDKVVADVAGQRQGALADDYFHLTLHYGAMRCLLSASSIVAAPRPRFALHGTQGSFIIRGLDPTEDALVAGKLPRDPDFRAALPPIRASLTRPDAQSDMEFPAGDWLGFYRELRDALRNDTPPPVDPAQILKTIEIIEAAHAA